MSDALKNVAEVGPSQYFSKDARIAELEAFVRAYDAWRRAYNARCNLEDGVERETAEAVYAVEDKAFEEVLNTRRVLRQPANSTSQGS